LLWVFCMEFLLFLLSLMFLASLLLPASLLVLLKLVSIQFV
jgi:hypothetical protein